MPLKRNSMMSIQDSKPSMKKRLELKMKLDNNNLMLKDLRSSKRLRRMFHSSTLSKKQSPTELLILMLESLLWKDKLVKMDLVMLSGRNSLISNLVWPHLRTLGSKNHSKDSLIIKREEATLKKSKITLVKRVK
jgi:hypothetical protein